MTERVTPLVYAVPEVAALLKVAPSTVHRWIKDGRVPAAAVVRYGSVVRIARWWIDELVGRAA